MQIEHTSHKPDGSLSRQLMALYCKHRKTNAADVDWGTSRSKSFLMTNKSTGLGYVTPKMGLSQHVSRII